MRAEVLNELKFINTSVMRLVISLLCAAFLLVATVFKVNFYIRSLIFVLSVANMRCVITEGFEDICGAKPSAKSLAAVGCFFSFLHALIVLDVAGNSFLVHSISLSSFAFGEYLKEKSFLKNEKVYSFTDRISALMILLASVLFVLTVVFNLVRGEGLYETSSRAFSAVALSCPVSVGAASATVAMLYAKIAAENGVFIKNAEALENLATVREIICDERGVLANEEYSLFDIYAVNGDKVELLSATAAIEARFSNSFANALINAAKTLGAEKFIAENCVEICGKGVSGSVNGDKYLLGNKRLFKDKKIELPCLLLKTEFYEKIPIYVAKNGKFAGVLLFHNQMKKDAVEAVDKIRALGKRCALLEASAHTASKGNFDILLSEREKVLQEFKKGVKIKAMVISKKPLVNASVVASIYPSDKADVTVGTISGAFYSLVIGSAAFSTSRRCTLTAFFISLTLAILSAMGVFVSSICFAFLSAAPLAFVLGVRRLKLPEITASEEDEMFGKINYTIKIDGMNCAHCSACVKNALEAIKGVSAKISLEEKVAHVKCSSKTTAEELAKAVSDAGFTVVSTERV